MNERSTKVAKVATVASGGHFDNFKWLICASLIAAGVVGNVRYAEESLLYRVLALLALVGLAAAVASQTVRGGELWALMKGARAEIRQVIWPTHVETVQTTLIVIVFVLIAAVMLWLIDAGLGWLAAWFIG